ncbi:MAG: two-component system, OmpR family, sensor histidine kinase KdpD [Actinomycetota bacterium]|jgi:signal transduction histidine kinase|nr:two-component system, OmpR family, sensor histidine kinase KdpD [Actinomycetota bacterium]
MILGVRPATTQNDDLQLRALVALIEAQNEQIESLRGAVGALEGRLALRSELDVIVAHEVRTPLTIVAGSLQTMQLLDHDDPRFADLLHRATQQAEHLAEIVNDLMSPQGVGGPAVHRTRLQTMPLETLVQRAVTGVSTRLEPERLRYNLAEGLKVTTAPQRLVAILVNLLENASRYGGRGPVDVGAYVDSEGDLHLTVADRGPGLRGATPESLFEPFVQGQCDGEDAARQGRGVGLYLVRMLAHSLGGDASIGERAGGGAVVEIVLPQRREADGLVDDANDDAIDHGHAAPFGQSQTGRQLR